MKKRIICFAMVIMLMSSSSITVFASDLSSLNYNNLGKTDSLQLMFAQLQLELAETAKQQALSKMAQIETLQEEQKQVSGFLDTAKQCQNEAKSTGDSTKMPPDMADYMIANNLSFDTTGNDLLMTGTEWDTAIASLESRLEMLGMETQQQMVYVQSSMEQYNSYIQGANTQISTLDSTLTSLASGQSMYGSSEVGLAVTGLVLGLVLGCVITLAVQKLNRKRDAV